jgi:hypothetical protein
MEEALAENIVVQPDKRKKYIVENLEGLTIGSEYSRP